MAVTLALRERYRKLGKIGNKTDIIMWGSDTFRRSGVSTDEQQKAATRERVRAHRARKAAEAAEAEKAKREKAEEALAYALDVMQGLTGRIEGPEGDERFVPGPFDLNTPVGRRIGRLSSALYDELERFREGRP